MTVTWQAQAGAGACLWRARGERPAYQLSCAPGDVTIGPGDAQGGPLAGDVYEVRDRGGAVLAAVALPAYANTAFLPLVVR